MEVPLLDLQAQYAPLREEIEAAVRRVLDAQQFVLGEEVAQLEEEVAAYAGGARAVACASGSDALLLALMALDVGPGDEVITSPFSFFSTAGTIHRLGARPVFADIEDDTFNLDPADVERRIGPRTRAIVAVHLYGRLARIEELAALASGHGVPLIEDAAQAFGARLGARRAGTLGRLGCYSFYPTKNLGGAGDGGMLITRDAALERRLRRLRNHGAEDRYYHREVGLNSRLDEVQAAVLRVKLRRLEEWNQARRERAACYDRLLSGLVRTPAPAPAGAHVYHQYVIRVPERDRLRQSLAGHGVQTAVYYPVPLHLQECFAYLGCRAGSLPRAEAAAREVLALPIYPELPEEAQQYVVRAIRGSLAGGKGKSGVKRQKAKGKSSRGAAAPVFSRAALRAAGGSGPERVRTSGGL